MQGGADATAQGQAAAQAIGTATATALAATSASTNVQGPHHPLIAVQHASILALQMNTAMSAPAICSWCYALIAGVFHAGSGYGAADASAQASATAKATAQAIASAVAKATNNNAQVSGCVGSSTATRFQTHSHRPASLRLAYQSIANRLHATCKSRFAHSAAIFDFVLKKVCLQATAAARASDLQTAIATAFASSQSSVQSTGVVDNES